MKGRTFLSYLLIGALTSSTYNCAYANPITKPKAKVVKVSWYGLEVEGNDMGCPSYGPFRMNDPTIVAHKTLPCGTKVRLENPETGKVIVAVVKDRGPYVKGRTFDLSAAAAEKLDPDKDEKGLLFVHFTIIKIGDSQ